MDRMNPKVQRFIRSLRMLVLFFVALVPWAVCAASDEIQVYTDEIAEIPGKTELEIHSNYTAQGRTNPDWAQEIPPHQGLRLTPEFIYGLTRTFDTALYLPTVISESGDLYIGGAKLRLKWLPVHGAAHSGGWFAGMNGEISYLSKKVSRSSWNSELRLMAGHRGERWLFAVNPILGWALSNGLRTGRPDTTFASKVMRRLGRYVAIGVEHYAGIGKIGRTLPHDMQSQTVYVVAEYERESFAMFHVGIGRGLTSATDDWTIKLIIEIP